ncbi:FAD/NAD(P)-binding protein [uncultured Methylobacterium sp.]|uniref:FAD/NAD(P)-binding protein n=1 Tax=uncultured Methylobacterium sp. TaxID=157278 RepID=UPI0035C9E776
MSDETEPARVNAKLLPVAVIGAGFSGTMAAIQLLARLAPHRGVLLCERAEQFGRGRAYATGNPDHLLNVRAANMSAYPDRPGHFADWLARLDERAEPGIRVTPAGTFAARGLYGQYLAELLTEAVTGRDAPRLHLVNDAIVDIRREDGRLSLHSEGGRTYAAAGAVLAMGNLAAPAEPGSRYRFDPWRSDAFGRLHPHLPAMIVGTGLTMVDAVMTLRRQGFAGRVVALSRRGLLPAAHAPAAAWPLPALSAADTASLSALVVRIRREIAAARAAGTDWRGVIDSLRPVTDDLWLGLPDAERGRFLRHLRPFWDVHRHRSAPTAGAAIGAEIAAGSLSVRAGRITAIEDGPSHARVTVRPRGTRGRESLDVQCILDARGIGTVAGTRDPLLSRLIGRGLVRPGPFGIGLDAAPDFSVRGGADGPGARLWTLGPLLRGVFWECTAVPDIRNQAAALAHAVAAELG